MRNGVRNLDRRAARMVAPQPPARMWLGQQVSHTGFILPYGVGAYRHSSMSGCCGLGQEPETGPGLLGWLVLVGGAAALVYTVLQAPKKRRA